VTVTTVSGSEEDGGIEDVCAYLARHGVAAAPRKIADNEANASDQVFHMVRERGADLIVAGGYSHSRMNERIFGGMTRDFLEHTPVCCLMAH
jgi:nucleotide-binding universal stress UspA family protein